MMPKQSRLYNRVRGAEEQWEAEEGLEMETEGKG